MKNMDSNGFPLSTPTNVGDISIEDLTVSGDTVITGNLTINGTQTAVNTETFIVEDPLVKYGLNNPSNLLDGGYLIEYTNSGKKYSGIIRDKSDGNTFKVIEGLTTEPVSSANNTTSYNTNLGKIRASNIKTDTNNTLLGDGVLTDATQDIETTAIGFDCMKNASGSSNTAIGYNALKCIDYGSVALNDTNNTGSENVCVGNFTGKVITTGAGNVLLGSNAGQSVVSGSDNILIGARSGSDIEVGNRNIYLGSVIGVDESDKFIVGSTSSILMKGDIATQTLGLNNLTSRSAVPLSLGVVAPATGVNIGSGTNPTAVLGTFKSNGIATIDNTTVSTLSTNGALIVKGGMGVAGAVNIGGALNTAGKITAVNFGDDANRNLFLGTITDPAPAGADNVCIGLRAGDSLAAGSRNVLIGVDTGTALTGVGSGGEQNILIGGSCGITMTGAVTGNARDNIGMGVNSMGSGAIVATTGSSNVALGVNSLRYLQSGESNFALGNAALTNITTGSNNIGIGFSAGDNLTSQNNAIVLNNSGSLKAGFADGLVVTSINSQGSGSLTGLKALVWDAGTGQIQYVQL